MQAKRFLSDVKAGEWSLLILFLGLLAATSVSLEIAYVLAVSGFLKQVTVELWPVVWIVDMVIILFVSALYTLIADRIPRLYLLQGLMFTLILAYLGFHLLFMLGIPDWFTYPALYLFADLQTKIFPLAFWALATDLFTVAQSKRLFPFIAGGGLIGQAVGSSLAAGSAQFFAQRHIPPSALLLVSVALFVIMYVGMIITFRRRRLPVQRITSDIQMREVLSVGWDFVRHVASFRYLTIAMLSAGFVLTIIEYHLMATSSRAISDATMYQSFYGIYRTVLTLATLGVQVVATSWLLRRAGLKNIFLVLPGTLIIASAWMLALPGILGGVAGSFVSRLAQESVEMPALQALQGLIPAERRGRVSAFMGSYLYTIGTIVGSVVLGLTILLTVQGWVSLWAATMIYLILGGAGAVIALGAAWKMREVYDDSLLDWRIARRHRRGTTAIDSALDALTQGGRNARPRAARTAVPPVSVASIQPIPAQEQATLDVLAPMAPSARTEEDDLALDVLAELGRQARATPRRGRKVGTTDQPEESPPTRNEL